jgi:hypothetical protein
MNKIRFVIIVYAFLQMLAMLTFLVVGKKHSRRIIPDDEKKNLVLVLVCTLLSVVLITLGIMLPGEA